MFLLLSFTDILQRKREIYSRAALTIEDAKSDAKRNDAEREEAKCPFFSEF